MSDAPYAQTYKELIEETDWSLYGRGKNPKCANCMAHCGYEPTAVVRTTGSVKESIRRPENNPPIKSLIEKGTHPYGMQTFQMAVSRLREEGVIDDAAAAEATGL